MASPAPATATIVVQGNVQGSVIAGDNNFVVNTNYGTIIHKEAGPRVKLRDMVPAPPRQPRGFIGRARERAQLEQLVASQQAAVIFGVDGVGKTTLVKQVANSSAAKAYPHGVLYLESIDEQGAALGLGDLIQRLFDALYESDPQLKVTAASARTYLSNTKPFVVVHRFNLPASALDTLTDLFPNAAILMTSTKAPPNDSVEPVKLGPLAHEESIQLLAAKSGITLDESNRKIVDALAALLADMPLALVTAANAIREKGVPLERAHEITAAIRPPAADPILAGIERAFAFAVTVLSPEEREMLSVVAALPGISVDRPWLEQVAGGTAVSVKLEALDLLQANSPRLRVPPGLRSAAVSLGDETSSREKLLAHYLDVLATRSLDFTFVGDELGNLLGLHERLFAEKRWEDVIRLGRAVDPYLTLRGLWDAWRTILLRVQEAAQAIKDRAVEAWALHQLGTREIGVGEKQQAIQLLQQALALRQSIGDREGAAYTLHNLNLILPPSPPPSGPREPSPLPTGGRKRNRALVPTLAAVIVALIGLGTVFASMLTAPQPIPVVSVATEPPAVPRALASPVVAVAAAPTPTWTPQVTAIAVSAAPTITSLPTATTRPSATSTSSPTATAVPCLPAPTLIDPFDTKTWFAKGTILRWSKSYKLGANEAFDVLVWPEGGKELTSIGRAFVNENSTENTFNIEFSSWPYSTVGKFFWTIRIIRLDGTVLSCPSKPFSFTLIPPPPSQYGANLPYSDPFVIETLQRQAASEQVSFPISAGMAGLSVVFLGMITLPARKRKDSRPRR